MPSKKKLFTKIVNNEVLPKIQSIKVCCIAITIFVKSATVHDDDKQQVSHLNIKQTYNTTIYFFFVRSMHNSLYTQPCLSILFKKIVAKLL